MADLSVAAPVETAKSGAYLHDRGRIPDPPARTRGEIASSFADIALGLLLALRFVALAFQTRDSWMRHRDWVVPVLVPPIVIGGVALGYLLVRGRLNAIGPAAVSLTLAVLLTMLNVWRGTYVDGTDGLQRALAILAPL